MKPLAFIFHLMIGAIGYTINGNMGWAIINFIFAEISLVKWIICQEITLLVIKQTFGWFFV